jgi:hypothetical protein
LAGWLAGYQRHERVKKCDLFGAGIKMGYSSKAKDFISDNDSNPFDYRGTSNK